MKINIKLDDGAVMPTRAHATDAGLDLYSREDVKVIFPRQMTMFDGDCAAVACPISEIFNTGVHIELPPGFFGKIESKSGLNVKHDIVSCGGVVDSGYTGSIHVKLYNLGNKPYTVRKGDKIAQLIIQPYIAPELEVVDKLPDTPRGANGFGSTGR